MEPAVERASSSRPSTATSGSRRGAADDMFFVEVRDDGEGISARVPAAGLQPVPAGRQLDARVATAASGSASRSSSNSSTCTAATVTRRRATVPGTGATFRLDVAVHAVAGQVDVGLERHLAPARSRTSLERAAGRTCACWPWRTSRTCSSRCAACSRTRARRSRRSPSGRDGARPAARRDRRISTCSSATSACRRWTATS